MTAELSLAFLDLSWFSLSISVRFSSLTDFSSVTFRFSFFHFQSFSVNFCFPLHFFKSTVSPFKHPLFCLFSHKLPPTIWFFSFCFVLLIYVQLFLLIFSLFFRYISKDRFIQIFFYLYFLLS